MEQNKGSWQMRDVSASDPRSFKAALQGRGDGRVEAYNRFRLEALKRDPAITEETLAEQYVAHVRPTVQKRAWREWSLNSLFQGYGRAFLSAIRAREASENALNQAAARHPGEILNQGFDAMIRHLTGGIVMFFVMYEIWHSLT